MALYLQFDKRQAAPSGLIPLKRGDDWQLSGQMVEKYARYQSPLDLTGCSATAYFEGDPSGTVTSVVQVVDELAGLVRIDLPASATPGVALSDSGTTIYTVVTHPTKGTITVENEVPVLEIEDRDFSEP